MNEHDISILIEALSLYDDKHDTNTEDLLAEMLEIKEKADCYDRIKDTINNSESLELTLSTIRGKINYTENKFLEDLGDGIF